MADKYWVGGGGANTWTTAANWSASSGGAGGAGFVSGTDNAIFDGVGVNANGTSVISATIGAAGLNMLPGFIGTLNISATFTITVNVVFGLNCTITGGAGIVCSGNISMTSNGKPVLGTLSLGTAGTKTLVDDWTVNGITNANLGNVIVNGNRLFMKGGLSNGSNVSGTTNLILQGGTWIGAGVISNNLTFDGNVTISGIVTYNTGTFKYLSGSITVTGSTFQINGSCTIDATGMTFDRVIPIATATITLLSNLDSNRIESNLGNTTFAGAYGWECNLLNWTFTTGSTTIFQEGIEYKINTQFTCNQTRLGATVTFRSSSGTNKAIITLKNGAICSVLANFTRIDASGGRTITTFIGTVTDCINIIRYDGNLPDNALTF